MSTSAQVARISVKNILFPTDFSAASGAALPFAQTLARIYDSTLLLAHVIPAEPHLQVTTDRFPPEEKKIWQDAKQKLAKFAHAHDLDNIPSQQLLDRGDLADVIPEMIREQKVDLVVLGTHGRTGVRKVVLGSGAEEIYRSAQCPVLTFGPKAQAAAWSLRRILCPVDVTEDPEPALHYALSLAEENQAELIILQAVPMVPWQHRESVEREERAHLERLIPAQAADRCVPQFLIRWEHPVDAILLAADDRRADLIVMGVRKARAAALSSHLPWPVASEVVSRAMCPVLTVRV